MKHKLTLLLGLFFLLSAFKADKPVITIFMIGDSTMANKSLVKIRNGGGGKCCPVISPRKYVWIIMP
jgi:hypothetical protein